MAFSPTTQEDLEHLTDTGIHKEHILKEAAKDFLIKELKYTEQEYQDLDLINVTRPKQQDTDRLYLHFSTQKSANFLFRKTISINNSSTNPNKNTTRLTPFIPPQLYNRFSDLSKNA